MIELSGAYHAERSPRCYTALELLTVAGGLSGVTPCVDEPPNLSTACDCDSGEAVVCLGILSHETEAW